MIDAAKALQELLESHYATYKEGVVDPFLHDVAALEQTLVAEHVVGGQGRVSCESLQALADALYALRQVEKTTETRRRMMERLALDGAGDWLT